MSTPLHQEIEYAARLKQELARAERRIREANAALVPLTEAEERQLIECQVRADSVYQQFGKQAPMALPGETPTTYRRRLVAAMQRYSPTWKDANLGNAHGKVLDFAEREIYADALKEAHSPSSVPEGTLREIKTTDGSGRVISTFIGEMDAWMDQFRSRGRSATIRDPRERWER